MSKSDFTSIQRISQNEERLRALESYCILDTAPEQAFDDIVKLLVAVCDVPVAIVSFIDSNRQFFKSEFGVGVRETPLEKSICAFTLMRNELFVIPDASQDAEFANHPAVKEQGGLRFYAGAPLQTPDGVGLGTLAVADFVPRVLSPVQEQALRTLASQVMSQLELRKTVVGLERTQGLFGAAFDQSVIGMAVTDLAGRVIRANDAFCKLVGRTQDELVGRDSRDYTHIDDRASNSEYIEKIENEDLESVIFEKRYIKKNGTVVYARVFLSPVRNRDKTLSGLIGVVEDITERRRAAKELAEAKLRLDAGLIAGDVGTFSWEIPADRLYGDSNFARIFNIELDETGAAPLSAYLEAIHPEDRDRIAELVADTVENGTRYEAEYRIITGEKLRWVVAKGRVEYDERGLPKRFPGVVVDITERKKAQEELAEATFEAERRRRVFDAALSSIPDHVFVFDLNHRYSYANRALLSVLGRAWDEVVGKKLHEIGVSLELAAQHDRELDYVISSGSTVRGQVPYTGAMGRRMYDYILVPVIGANGRVESVAGTARDITELKAKEDRDRFFLKIEELAREADDPVVVIDRIAELLGRHLGVNRCAYADVEEDQETFNLIGDYNFEVSSIVGRYSFRQFGEECLNLMRIGEVYVVFDASTDVRTELVRDAYRLTDIRSVICVPLLKAGKLAGAMAVHQAVPRVWTSEEIEIVKHVTNRCWESIERIRVTRELLSSEERHRILTENISAIVWNFDRSGAILGESRSWERFTGQTKGLYLGWGWLNAVHPDDRYHTRMRWENALAGTSPYEAEYRLLRYDGKYRLVIARAAPVIGGDGSPKEWIANCSDITEQRESELERERLLDSERAARSEIERISQLKDEFLATLSHELRTPLNAILGWSQLLQRSPRNEQRVSEGMEVIERNARAQTRLIEDLLDMSRIVSGKLRLDMQEVDLSEVAQSSVEAVMPTARTKDVRIESLIEENLPKVTCDPARVQQVIWNLLTNALKFTSSGGRVLLQIRKVEADVEVQVVDNGMGIPAEFLPHVFERFRQADASTTRRYGGLGLGLALVRQLTELHRGTVRAESPGIGLGSKFTITLPISSSSVGSRPFTPVTKSTTETNHDLSGARILVVDDEPDARLLLERVLNEAGAVVTSKATVSEAMSAIEEQWPDMIISDISMPGEDGYSFIRRLREVECGRSSVTPVLALTAFARSEDRKRALAAGFQFHATKPIEPAEVVTIVAGMLGRIPVGN